MSSPNSSHTRSGVSAPEKGSFPLDHFKECEDIIENYLFCIRKHELMPKRCQKLQVEYLNCRMEHGLMKKESMEDLGFTKQNTLESEMNQKKNLYMKYAMLQQEAQTNVENYFKQREEKIDENLIQNKVNDEFKNNIIIDEYKKFQKTSSSKENK